jgi:hypothetical protein
MFNIIIILAFPSNGAYKSCTSFGIRKIDISHIPKY